jgi:hypothetical protein
MKYFKKQNSLEMAKEELENSKRAYLQNQTHSEYYRAQVEFEENRMNRLLAYIDTMEGTKKK